MNFMYFLSITNYQDFFWTRNDRKNVLSSMMSSFKHKRFLANASFSWLKSRSLDDNDAGSVKIRKATFDSIGNFLICDNQ